MASISSLSSVYLWLDATDLSTITFNPIGSDVLQWRDKTSNGWTFNNLRSGDRPIWSTNAILFNQVSSFQFISQQKIPVLSTTDIFAIITPDSLLGPRQPLFDNADVTISETDKRINTQVYADGGEFWRACYTSNYARSYAIYKGDLYTGMDVGQTINYLQRYNSNVRGFEVFPFPISSMGNGLRALSVYNGSLFVNGGGGMSNERSFWWNGSTAFVSTNFVSSSLYSHVVYNKELYIGTFGFITSGSNAAARPQLYKWSSPTLNVAASTVNVGSGRWQLVTELQNGLTANIGWQMYPNGGMLPFRGDMYVGTDGNFNGLQRYNNNLGFNCNVIFGGPIYQLGVFNGNMIIGFNESRLFRYNDNARINFGRLNFGTPSGGFVTYKGNLWVMKNTNQNNSNTMEIFFGEQGGFQSNSYTSNVTTNTTAINMYGGFIVHDGKIFMHWNQSGYMVEYGNGTTLDQPIDTLLGNAPILLQIRKSPTTCQMYLNGNLVQNQATSFTFSNQPPRFVYVGGAAGTLNSATQSDAGSDHFQGGLHTLVQFNSNLVTTDRQRVEGILAWQYGIQSVLPSNHPYKNAAPT
jgi:hypothetical protein